MTHAFDVTPRPRPLQKKKMTQKQLRDAIALQTLHPQDGTWTSTSNKRDRKLKKLKRQNRKKGRK